VSPDAHSPAQRADAVLRAAEAAAAAAAQTGATSLPSAPALPDARPPTEDAATPEASPHPHEAGAPARLLSAAGELEVSVAQARAQLDALERAFERLIGPRE
jgi:hypothetical protein